MAAKFSRNKLKNALIDQPLCCHSAEIAEWLLDKGVTEEHVKDGTTLIKENDFDDTDVFLILAGSFEIDVGGNIVGSRVSNSHIGEMAMILASGRTASATARTDSFVVRIPEELMLEAYREFPQIWESIAKTLCHRLNERKKFFRIKNEYPKIFIASSGASVRVAKTVAAGLRKKLPANFLTQVWDDEQIFTPSSVIINRLTERAKESDFGIFIFAADDKISIKGKDKSTPRDNVIFEGGLFTAAFGLDRTFYLCEKDKDLHVLSDLAGVTYLEFSRENGGLQFGKSISRIASIITKMGSI